VADDRDHGRLLLVRCQCSTRNFWRGDGGGLYAMLSFGRIVEVAGVEDHGLLTSDEVGLRSC
jgi:hypothetical protein